MVEVSEVRLDQIIVEDSIRKTFDEDSIKELASSIERHGILQPITVQRRPDGTYTLLIGERRCIAAKRVGMGVVPAMIKDEKPNPDKSLETRLVENIHREDLDPMDEAEAYQQLIDVGLGVSETARRVGKPRYYVSKSLRLLRLHPKLREAVRQRTLTSGHAHELLRLEPEQQLVVAEEVQEKGFTEKDTRERVREVLGRQLPWRLIPIRLSLEEYGVLEKIAPEGDVERLIREAVERLTRRASRRSKRSEASK